MKDTTSFSALRAICRRGAVCMALALAAGLAGCQTAALRAPVAQRFWPALPAVPCVQFVRSAELPRELGVRPGALQRMANFFVGGNRGSEPWVNPFGVCFGPKGLLCFTDTARAEVVCVDMQGNALSRWSRVGTNLLSVPVGVAVANGTVVVADSGLGRVLLATPRGKPLGELAFPFQRPVAVAATRALIFVADAVANRVQVFSADGRWLRSIGKPGRGAGELNHPTHVAADPRGLLYVSDSLNSRIQMFDDRGTYIRAIGSPGDSSGHFGRPKGVAVDDRGDVFVVDGLNGVVQGFDRNGRFLVNFGEPGRGVGQFWLPAGIAINRDGLVAVADCYNRRLQLFRLLPSRPVSAPAASIIRRVSS